MTYEASRPAHLRQWVAGIPGRRTACGRGRRAVPVWGPLVMLIGTTALPRAAWAQLCPTGTISEIVFDRQKPFDADATSDEARLGWIFRRMNAVHVRTLPAAIRWELLFREGDCLDPVLLEESARGLRSLPYLQEASVTSERLTDGSNRVMVEVVDSWALSPGLSITVDQGFQITGLSLNWMNVLGSGTHLAWFDNEYRERARRGFLGRQPNVFGTRIDATLHGGDTRPGAYMVQSLFRPYSGEVGVNAFRQGVELRDDYFLYSVDPALGFTQALVRFETERYEATYQRRFGDEVGARFVAGLGVSREVARFPFGVEGIRIVADNEFDESVQAPSEVVDEVSTQLRDHATNRVNLVLGFRNLSFLNVIGLDALAASQDIFDGGGLTLTIAPAVPVGDGDVTDVLLRLQGALGIRAGRHYVRVSGDIQGRQVYSDPVASIKGWRDHMSEVVADGYWDQRAGLQLYSRISYASGHRMGRPFQLTVGGREAVRGYNEDAFPGAHRLLVTLEQRFDLPGLSSGFAGLGAAVFADGGRAWAGDVPFGADTEWKTGIGAGLRIALPRGSSRIVRIDFGIPLTGQRETLGTVFRLYTELFGVLDRRAWPTQIDRSRWYGTSPDLATRPTNPLSSN